MILRMLLLIAVGLGLPGCLTTRAELREQETQRPVLTPAQEKRAQEVIRQDEADQQFRALNGRIDVLENQMSQFNAGHADSQALEKRGHEETEKRFHAYEEALGKMEQQLNAIGEDVRALKARKEAEQAPAPRKGSESFAAAEQAFEKKDWKSAIVDYENYRKASPKGKNYATATLKIGMSFHELGMKDEAKAFFEEVIAKFPGTKEAKKAGQRIKAMK